MRTIRLILISFKSEIIYKEKTELKLTKHEQEALRRELAEKFGVKIGCVFFEYDKQN